MANTGGLSALTKAQLVDLLTTAGEAPNPQGNKTEVHSRVKTVVDGLIKKPPTCGMANMTLGQLRTRERSGTGVCTEEPKSRLDDPHQADA